MVLAMARYSGSANILLTVRIFCRKFVESIISKYSFAKKLFPTPIIFGQIIEQDLLFKIKSCSLTFNLGE